MSLIEDAVRSELLQFVIAGLNDVMLLRFAKSDSTIALVCRGSVFVGVALKMRI